MRLFSAINDKQNSWVAWSDPNGVCLSAAIRRFEVRVKKEPDLAGKVETLKGELEVAIFQA
jgi:hypothetical protein